MSLREHYFHKLDDLTTEFQALGQMVVAAITNALTAYEHPDPAVAQAIIDQDCKINQARYHLEEQALTLIATQQPCAGDLRRLIAILTLAGELERIGDYAKGIAAITLRSVEYARRPTHIALAAMAEQAVTMLTIALDAFVHHDDTSASYLGELEDRMDVLAGCMRADMLIYLQIDPAMVTPVIDLLTIAHLLERIADRTTNIAERVVFMIKGEMVELNV